MTIEELAEYAKSFFTTTQRPDGTRIYVLKDRYPSWVYRMVYKAHDDGNWLPDDYKYEYVVETLDALSEGRVPEEGMTEIEPDVYTRDLQNWLTSHRERSAYVDEAVREMGYPDQGLDQAFMFGQIAEKEEVWRIVVSALEERLEAIELGEEEEMESRAPKKGRGGRRQDWSPR